MSNVADLRAIETKLADRQAVLATARANEDLAHQVADLEFDTELLTARWVTLSSELGRIAA